MERIKPITRQVPEVTDLSEELTWIDLGFTVLDLTWQSHRIRLWMDGVSKRMGKPVVTQYDLPPEAIKALAKKLREELGQQQRSR